MPCIYCIYRGGIAGSGSYFQLGEVPSGTTCGDLCSELTVAVGDTEEYLSGREAVFRGESSIPFRFPWVYHKNHTTDSKGSVVFYALLLPGQDPKARSNRSDPAAVKERQNPHHGNSVTGFRFYRLFQLTVSPRFFAFFMPWPGGRKTAFWTPSERLNRPLPRSLQVPRSTIWNPFPYFRKLSSAPGDTDR